MEKDHGVGRECNNLFEQLIVGRPQQKDLLYPVLVAKDFLFRGFYPEWIQCRNDRNVFRIGFKTKCEIDCLSQTHGEHHARNPWGPSLTCVLPAAEAHKDNWRARKYFVSVLHAEIKRPGTRRNHEVEFQSGIPSAKSLRFTRKEGIDLFV